MDKSQNPYWVQPFHHRNKKYIPYHAVTVGWDESGCPLFIARVTYKESILTGYIKYGNTKAIIVSNLGEVVHCADFEVYTGPVKWKASGPPKSPVSAKKGDPPQQSNIVIPGGSIVAGFEDDGKPIFIVLAKIVKSSTTASIPGYIASGNTSANIAVPGGNVEQVDYKNLSVLVSSAYCDDDTGSVSQIVPKDTE